MRSKILLLCFLIGWGNLLFAAKTSIDSILVSSINKKAQNPDFVHVYLLDVSPGKAYYSIFGHVAIRMVCPSKKLDYCFSFEMNMKESSKLDLLTRNVKAGFGVLSTSDFLKSYQEEGRSVTAYEINLTPKEKQELWKFLDQSVCSGATWTFDYTSINCLSMAFYALNSALMPEQIEFRNLPPATKLSFEEWKDEITRQSPWMNLLSHAIFLTEDGSNMMQEDKITPEMLKDVLHQAIIIDSCGRTRPLVLGKPNMLLPQIYHDKPYWFKPWMLFGILIFVSIVTWGIIYKKQKKYKV